LFINCTNEKYLQPKIKKELAIFAEIVYLIVIKEVAMLYIM